AGNGFADQRRDAHAADIGGGLDRFGFKDRVGDHEFLELAAGDTLGSGAGQNAMGDIGGYFLGTGLEQRLGGVDQGATAIDDVVDENAGLARDVADDVHHLGNAGARTALVDYGEVGADAAGHIASAHHTAHV